MTERLSTGIEWRRLLAESLAVILSILLAFSIDAWWEGRQEVQRERELMVGLLADFQSSRPGLEERLVLARRMAAGTAGFLDLLGAYEGPTALSVPDSLVLAVLGGPTYEPATNTLDAAVASGKIERLTSDELRATLANWRRMLMDTREDELEVRRITNEQLAPLLARSLDLRSYFDGVLPWSGGDQHGAGRLIGGGTVADSSAATPVTITTELIGALALRKFYVDFAAADLEDLLAALDRTVELLVRQLAG
jgi:hypothetical protein